MSDRDYFRHDYQGGGVGRGAFWATDRGTKILLAVMLGVHLLLSLLRAVAPGAFWPLQRALVLDPRAVVEQFEVWRLVTSALLHADTMHLLFNSIGIWFFGRMVEHRLGMRRFFLFCLGASLSACFAYILWSYVRGSVTPALGASGVDMGVIALAALWYPFEQILFFFVPVKLWILAVVLVVLDLVSALDVSSDIAHTAHLGGALYGYLYYKFAPRFGGMFAAIDKRAQAKQRQRARRTEAENADLRAEVDRILDKVNREGMSALSAEEKSFLKRASGKLGE